MIDYQSVPQLWIQIPICSKIFRSTLWRSDISQPVCDEGLDDSKDVDTWLFWNEFRSHLSPDKRIGAVLELSGDLPDEKYLARWEGEPIKAVIIPTSIFLTNRKGYPVLSKAHQLFLRKLIFRMAGDIQFIMKGNCHHGNMHHYVQYIEHLKQTQACAYPDPVTEYAKGYEDYLQVPLQVRI